MSKDRNPGNDDQGEDDTQRHEDQNSRMRSSGEVLGSGNPGLRFICAFDFIDSTSFTGPSARPGRDHPSASGIAKQGPFSGFPHRISILYLSCYFYTSYTIQLEALGGIRGTVIDETGVPLRAFSVSPRIIEGDRQVTRGTCEDFPV